MKHLLSIAFVFFSYGVFGCDCNFPNLTEKYISSEFVAAITITNIYLNEKDEHWYKADIEVNELFKGENLESILVYGRSDGGFGSSCDIFIPSGAKLIAFSKKNQNGEVYIDMCSGFLYLDYNFQLRNPTKKSKKQIERQETEIEILQLLRKKNISYTSDIPYQPDIHFSKRLEQFKGVSLDKRYALFEIIFAQDLSVKEIIEISGFDHPIDEELKELFKNTMWTKRRIDEDKTLQNGSRFLIGIYYYKQEKDESSFLSHFYF